MSQKIGVFPASGGLGTSIVNHLLKLVPATQLVLIARNPDKLAHLSRAGATVRRGDYDDPQTLERVFDEVGILMLISYASIEFDHRVSVQKLAIDEARRSGVKHIFYTSLAFGGNVEETSAAYVMHAHLETEKYLAELPGFFTYTAIREGIYSEAFPLYTAWLDLRSPRTEIPIPHNGSGPGVAWAKKDELGEANAKMMVSYTKNPQAFPYLNQVILLSGPKEWSLKDTVNAVGRITGYPMHIREITVDEYAMLPENAVKYTYRGVNLSREWATVWEGIRRGETAVVSYILKDWLGREPEDFETTISRLAEGV